MQLAGKVLRLIALCEFAGALITWRVGALDWGLCALIATLTLIVALGGLEPE